MKRALAVTFKLAACVFTAGLIPAVLLFQFGFRETYQFLLSEEL